MTEASSAGHLMNVLISKMEVMDNDLALIKAENVALKHMMSNPQVLMKKMGLVPVTTSLPTDLSVDPLRADLEMGDIMKGITSSVPQSNEEFHQTSWDEIHEMAQDAKDTEMTA